MSYIRCGWPLRYVDDVSEDYVYGSGKGITDYGSISDNGIIELLFSNWKTDDDEFKTHLLKRLSERLDVKLRAKPLTSDEVMEKMEELMKAQQTEPKK